MTILSKHKTLVCHTIKIETRKKKSNETEKSQNDRTEKLRKSDLIKESKGTESTGTMTLCCFVNKTSYRKLNQTNYKGVLI